MSNGVTYQSTAPNFFRSASIDRAPAKLLIRVLPYGDYYCWLLLGSFFVFILTWWSMLPATALPEAEDVSLLHAAGSGLFATGLNSLRSGSSDRSRTPIVLFFPGRPISATEALCLKGPAGERPPRGAAKLSENIVLIVAQSVKISFLSLGCERFPHYAALLSGRLMSPSIFSGSYLTPLVIIAYRTRRSLHATAIRACIFFSGFLSLVR